MPQEICPCCGGRVSLAAGKSKKVDVFSIDGDIGSSIVTATISLGEGQTLTIRGNATLRIAAADFRELTVDPDPATPLLFTPEELGATTFEDNDSGVEVEETMAPRPAGLREKRERIKHHFAFGVLVASLWVTWWNLINLTIEPVQDWQLTVHPIIADLVGGLGSLAGIGSFVLAAWVQGRMALWRKGFAHHYSLNVPVIIDRF